MNNDEYEDQTMKLSSDSEGDTERRMNRET